MYHSMRITEVADGKGQIKLDISHESILKSPEHTRSGPVITRTRMQAI